MRQSKRYGLLIAILLAGLACGRATPAVLPPSPLPPTQVAATDVPLPTDTPIPTVESVADFTATPTQILTPTQITAPIVPPPIINGPCANPLYPLTPGNEWVYQVSPEGGSSDFAIQVVEIQDGTAMLTALDMSTGVTTQMSAECQDGAIINFPLLMMGLVTGNAEGIWQLEHVSGVFAPAYQTFADQNWDLTWEGVYLASGNLSATEDGETVSGTLENSPITMTWKTAGGGEALFDAVTVPAGEFPKAIKISRDLTLDFTLSITSEGQTNTVSAVLVLKNTLWFEPNLGLVKQQVERATLRISGIPYPLTIDSTLELVEFHPGG